MLVLLRCNISFLDFFVTVMCLLDLVFTVTFPLDVLNSTVYTNQ